MIEISRDSNVERAAKRELATRREFVRRAAGLVALGGMARPALADDLKTGLVSYWELNEESGTRYDAHGSNDLTDNNTVGYATGKLNNAADFERADSEYLSKSNAYSAGLSPESSDYSWSGWIKAESVPAIYDGHPITGAGTNWCLRYDVGSGYAGWFTLQRFVGSWNDHAVQYTISAGTWYHVVIVWDHSNHTLTLYINGSSAGSDSSGSTTSQVTWNDPFRLGRNEYGYWDGLIDEVGFWSRKLTPDEVTTLYNDGTPLPYSSFNPPAKRRIVVIF